MMQRPEIGRVYARRALVSDTIIRFESSGLWTMMRHARGDHIEVSAVDRERLAAVVADRNSLQKHVWRARIILATAEGCGTGEIMRRARVSKPCVWRWPERFMREGVTGLLRDKTRKPGLPPLVDRVIALTLGDTRPDDALDRPGDGRGHRYLAALGAADLGGAPPAAASRAALQAVAGSGVCRQAARCGRTIPRPASPQPCALG